MPLKYSERTRDIQIALKKHRFDPGAIDGLQGPRTSAAIIAFKRSIGFRARDYVGPLTWAALHGPELPKTPVTTAPVPWLAEGYKRMGLHEGRNNSILRRWLASDGHALGDPSRFPWCGDFVETCIRLALPQERFTGDLARNPYWALNWREFGQPCKPTVGAVISITRNGGGHVAFAVGEDARRIYCLGGNQQNRVCVVPIDKNRFVPASWRWPLSYPLPAPGLPAMTSAEASSINEA